MRPSTADIANALALSKKPSGRFSDFNEIHKALVFFRKTHYDQYVPTLGSNHHDFDARLGAWLQNVNDDDDRALLLELAPRIVFLSREDMAKLQEAAMRGPISRWIFDTARLSMADVDFDSKLRIEIENHTWFTAITDSMQISEFHHVNQLGGTDFRPDWKSLAQFGDPGKICLYMQQHTSQGANSPLRRIVILEDFVGSGTQMAMGKGSVQFAAATFPNTPILLCPLLCCPEGARAARALCSQYHNLTFEPVIEIGQNELVSQISQSAGPPYEARLSQFCESSYADVAGQQVDLRPYGPWGFADTGCLIVMYTNSPANTLPIVQHQSNSWTALFPRSARIK